MVLMSTFETSLFLFQLYFFERFHVFRFYYVLFLGHLCFAFFKKSYS
jgi:hypothetical protein